MLCQEFFRNGSIFPANETFEIDAQVETGKYWLNVLVKKKNRFVFTVFSALSSSF